MVHFIFQVTPLENDLEFRKKKRYHQSRVYLDDQFDLFNLMIEVESREIPGTPKDMGPPYGKLPIPFPYL